MPVGLKISVRDWDFRSSSRLASNFFARAESIRTSSERFYRHATVVRTHETVSTAECASAILRALRIIHAQVRASDTEIHIPCQERAVTGAGRHNTPSTNLYQSASSAPDGSALLPEPGDPACSGYSLSQFSDIMEASPDGTREIRFTDWLGLNYFRGDETIARRRARPNYVHQCRFRQRQF